MAAFGLGGFLVYQNSDAGVGWKSPAIFIGIPATIFLLLSIAGTIIFSGISKLTTLDRSGPLQPAVAAAIAFGYVSYQIVREHSAPNWMRLTAGLAGAVAAGIVAFLVARRPWAGVIAKIGMAAGLLSILASMVALAVIHAPAGVLAADPRSAVPIFEPRADPPKRDPVPGRLFVFGVDGATWDLIDPLLQQNRLPNFAKLKSGGAWSRLRTLKPTVSPAIWTSVVTGKTPTRHGVQDFFVRHARFLKGVNLQMENRALRWVFSTLKLYDILPVTSNLRNTKAIWNMASEVGMTVGVVGWWATYPAETVNGTLISDAANAGWIQRHLGRNESLKLQTTAMSFPPDRLVSLSRHTRPVSSISRDELARFVPVTDRLWEDFHKDETLTKDEPLSLFHRTYLSDEFFHASALDINATACPDLLMCYVRMIDGLGHFCWHLTEPECIELGVSREEHETYKNIISNGYAWIDSMLEKMFQCMKDGDVLVVLSDHGWERVSKGVYHHANAPDGILAVYGANIKKGFQIPEIPHIFDICPTLLNLAGLPKGADMPGRVLEEIFEKPVRKREIPTWEAGRGRGAEGAIAPDATDSIHELEQFGYIKSGAK